MKKVVKSVLLLGASLFLLFRSVEIMRLIIQAQPEDLETNEQLFVGVLLAIFLTGVVALPGFALPTSRLLPNVYYQIKNPTLLNKTYRLLGIGAFRKLLMLGYWGKQKNRKHYFDGTRSGFNNLIYQSKQSEFGHLLPFIVLQIIAILCFIKGVGVIALVVTVINIIGNFYPIPLQRMHRYRISRLQSLSEKRNGIS
jgi:hypothetical protein